MKKILLSLCIAICSFNSFSQLTYIPDDGFEYYLETTFPAVNNGIINDDFILTSGIPSVTSINLSGMFGDIVNDFTGIGSFTSLQFINISTMLTSNIDLSSLDNVFTGILNYTQVKIEYCNNLISVTLPNNRITTQITDNPILQNITFQNTNIFCFVNAFQNNNSIEFIDLSNTSGVYAGASLTVSGNTNLNCLKIDNGQCNNWLSVLTMPNGTANATTPGGTLYCVQVDSPAYSEIAGNWSFSSASIPSSYYYSTNCGCVTSIDEEILDEVTISPNPTTSKINVKSNTELIGSQFIVYDQLGKEVKSGIITSEETEIDLSNLIEGVYIFKVGADMQESFKIIKQ
jgi:hypothetical protein